MNVRCLMFPVLCMVLLAAVAAPGRAEDYDLAIITPHNDDIQQEFQRAFSQHVGRPLKIRWIKKGTGEILQQFEAQDRGAKGGSFDLDLFFGGGVPDHDLAAAKGYLEAPVLPPDAISAIPADIAGVANFHPQKLWLGCALGSFGILVNERGLKTQNLPPIQSWQDLAEPRFNSWVVIADPRKSASVRVCYELILQQYGWEKGWPILAQIAANSRLITPSSSAVPNEIATGNVLAGPCIDLYAYARAAQAGPGVLAFVLPPGGSAITPDPIALLRKAPHKSLAEQFIAFVLTPAGQRLWTYPAGVSGGPQDHALFRLPIRQDICAEAAQKGYAKDPYQLAAEGTFLKVDDNLQRARSQILAELMGAALIDPHTELRAAWKALIDGGMKPAALAEWQKPPFSAAQALELAQKIDAGGRGARTLVQDWSDAAREKYRRVIALSK